MLKIKKTSLILIVIALSACEPGRVANRHLPTIFNAGKFTCGGWIVAEVMGRKDLLSSYNVSGELISYQEHKLYILDTGQIYIVPDSSVYQASLYMYKKQPGIFAALTVIGILPNVIAAIALPEYSGYFLALGAVPLVIVTAFTLSEVATRRNQLIFPEKNSLEEFIKFSRFPQGIPPGMDIHRLKLPERKHDDKKN